MNRPKTAHYKRTHDFIASSPSPIECPLNNPELPIVSELDHKTGHCYCHHCICGKHSCLAYPKSKTPTWSTQYKKDYNTKVSIKTDPYLPQEYLSF